MRLDHAVLPRAVVMRGLRDQGKPEPLPYRYGCAKPWAVKALRFQKPSWIEGVGARSVMVTTSADVPDG